MRIWGVVGFHLKCVYINFHICSWKKEITCHVTCVVTDISYFHLSKQSRPSSGSSYNRSLIWVNSVRKSVKMRLFEENKEGHSFFILLFLPKLSTAVWCTLKCVDIEVKFIEKCFNFISSDLMFNWYMYISASFVYLHNPFIIHEIGCFYIKEP